MAERVIKEVRVEQPPEKAEVVLSEEEVVYSAESLGIVYPKGLGLFDADLIPDSIPKATLHVFSVKLDGDYITNVKNTGMARLFRTSLTHSLLESSQNFSLFKDVTKSIGTLKRGSTASVEHGWSVKGIIGVLWALITIFFTGKARVLEEATITAFRFKKTFKKDVWVPVKSVSVAWN